MFQQMEKARKEELDKATARKVTAKNDVKAVEGVNHYIDKTADVKYSKRKSTSSGMGGGVSGGQLGIQASVNGNNIRPAGTENRDRDTQGERTAFVHKDNVLEINEITFGDFAKEDIADDDAMKEQLKIFEEIKLRNEERKRQEEMNMKLIADLSLAETEGEEQVTANCTEAAAVSDSWPDLREAAAGGGAGRVVVEGETARQKIARLKETADRRGMSVNTLGLGYERVRERGGRLSRPICGEEEKEEALVDKNQRRVEGNGKLGKKEMKKNTKLIRERRKSEAMGEFELERRRAAEELKERMAAQEREEWDKFGRMNPTGQSKRRTKSGK
eukprot:GFUD01020313.1.p1 GENE.GFUD01020313.1~~GFUD01020313.1.p1  ORF type:complete len:331 (-),score=133.55 GFUD01020313.1:178-1170(-)